MPLHVGQPEEQHGFRAHYRLEGDLITANLVVDKLLIINAPIWVVSLDLSKAFDRVNWKKIWLALHDHGVSEQIMHPEILYRTRSNAIGLNTLVPRANLDFGSMMNRVMDQEAGTFPLTSSSLYNGSHHTHVIIALVVLQLPHCILHLVK